MQKNRSYRFAEYSRKRDVSEIALITALVFNIR